ncbi:MULTISPECIES: ABC transporter substrate-binding protein [unclassified Pseudomonas]|uniref:ABC transporter substrate-binding protein n=1 Tax=unclassified Pseudomonas TaxID=196821 RepID=UPI000CD1D4CC|nr:MULTISPECIES: ABC transporter substrate-binding protein [unclassified Pseudomonas]POA50953.1 ABC transporter substrate-binding protein [Pseudomonas sp. FW507-12TSA]
MARSRKGLPRLGWSLVLLGWLLCAPLRAAEVLLTASEDSDSVRSFARELAELRPQDQVRFEPLGQLPAPGLLPAATRLILLDPQSLDWRLQDAQGPPTLVLRISRLQAAQRLPGTPQPRLTLLWSDPPGARQLRLIREVLPQVRRVGVLYSQDSRFLLEELRQAARAQGLEIVAEAWNDIGDSRPLQEVLRNSEVLLGLDDPSLYNPKTVKNLLLSSYARQQALIGPNAGFVRAGSLASTYSDQQDWLQTLDQLLDRPPAQWPRSQYPAAFKVLSNPQVARSLGIEEIDPETVARQLSEGEKRP